MKRFEIRLTGDSQFSHGVVKAGTLVGTLVMSEPIEPTSLLSMIQFSQACIEEKTESNFDHVVLTEETIDTTLDGLDSEKSSEELIDSDESDTEVFEENQSVVGDLADFLDESLIESLAANEIFTKEKLFEVIASGKDLTELEKIGPTRAKRILAAVAAMQETQQ